MVTNTLIELAPEKVTFWCFRPSEGIEDKPLLSYAKMKHNVLHLLRFKESFVKPFTILIRKVCSCERPELRGEFFS
jgi:hypothetical protein